MKIEVTPGTKPGNVDLHYHPVGQGTEIKLIGLTGEVEREFIAALKLRGVTLAATPDGKRWIVRES